MNRDDLKDKILELTDRLVDVVENNGLHILINVTLIDGDSYSDFLGHSAGIETSKLMYASLAQSANLLNSIK